jgi:hypothetical protein
VWSTKTPAVLQHEFEIAVTDREPELPAHRPQDHLRGELPPLDPSALTHRRTCPEPATKQTLLEGPSLRKPATEPGMAR